MQFDHLEEMEKRLLELDKLISTPEIATDPYKLAIYAKERGSIAGIVQEYRIYKEVLLKIEEAESIINEEEDPELIELAKKASPVANTVSRPTPVNVRLVK